MKNVKMKRIISRVLVLALAFNISITLTGCESLDTTGCTQLVAQVSARLDSNRALINNLYNAGLITEGEMNDINGNFDKIYASLNTITSSNQSAVIDLLKASVGYTTIETSGDTVNINGPEKSGSNGTLGYYWKEVKYLDSNNNEVTEIVPFFNSASFIPNCVESASSLRSHVPALSENKGVTPIVLIDQQIAASINERLTYPIYILDPSKDISIDEVSAWLNDNYVGGTPSANFFSGAEKYFVPLMDAANPSQQVTLLDMSTSDAALENMIVQPSRAFKKNSDDNMCTDPTYDINTKKWDYGHGIKAQQVMNHRYGLQYEDYISNPGTATRTDIPISTEPGTDLSLSINSNGETVVCMQVRLVEVNQKAYNHVRNTLGLGDKQYIVAATGSEGRVYLLQYPVGYVDGFKLNGDKTEFESIIKKSSLAINILNKKIMKVDINGETVEANGLDPYIWVSKGETSTVDVSLSESGTTATRNVTSNIKTSSFVKYGETGYDPAAGTAGYDGDAWNLKQYKMVGANTRSSFCYVNLPRFVLRDYLEMTYSPDAVAGETLAAYGRMIRITSFKGPISDTMACYRPPDGNTEPTRNLQKLFVSDFSDVVGLKDSTPINKKLPTVSSTEVDNADDIAGVSYDTTPAKIEELKTQYVSKIKSTYRLPSASIDKADLDQLFSNDKPIFYCMAVNKTSLTSGLMNWISSDSDSESLKWWLSWLKSHNFNYMTDTDGLADFFTKNYLYQLQDNLIILNMETISKINEELSQENKVEHSRTTRTIFKIIGFVLISWSLLMYVAWATDIGVDLGYNVLTKVTFGRYVAIHDESEIPQTNEGGPIYVGFQTITMSCLKVLVIGLILVFLDVTGIVALLVRIVSSLVNTIGQMIGG